MYDLDPLEGLPPPPPRDKIENRRPQLRTRRNVVDLEADAVLGNSWLAPAEPRVPAGAGTAAGPAHTRSIEQSRRLVERKSTHAANAVKAKTGQLRKEELSAELIAGFREAMEAAEMKLKTSAVEKAQMLALLKLKDVALQQAQAGAAPGSGGNSVDPPIMTQALQIADTDRGAEADMELGSPSAQLARL